MQERGEVWRDVAQRALPVYESVMQNLVQSGALRRQEEHYAALQQALQNIPPISPEVMRSWQAATETLNSPRFLDRLERARQVGEIAAQRFGPDGVAAAQQLAAQRLVAGPDLEQAAERIRGGEVNDLLNEAADLAASPEVRETIEQAEKDEILRFAEEWTDREAPTDAGEPDLEAGPHTEEAGEYSQSSKEKLLELFDKTLKLWLVIGVAGAAALVVANPVLSLPNLVAMHNGLLCLLQLLERQIASWSDKDE